MKFLTPRQLQQLTAAARVETKPIRDCAGDTAPDLENLVRVLLTEITSTRNWIVENMPNKRLPWQDAIEDEELAERVMREVCEMRLARTQPQPLHILSAL